MGVEIPMSTGITQMLHIRGGKVRVIQRDGGVLQDDQMQGFYRYFIRFDTMSIVLFLTTVAPQKFPTYSCLHNILPAINNSRCPPVSPNSSQKNCWFPIIRDTWED
jgi:hypothetical protein